MRHEAPTQHPKEYQNWYDSHKAHCNKNFSGSSQSMEPEAAMTIWKRSTENRQLCSTIFIGDGDSKSYQQISKMKPYGSLLIHKKECLAHVSKPGLGFVRSKLVLDGTVDKTRFKPVKTGQNWTKPKGSYKSLQRVCNH